MLYSSSSFIGRSLLMVGLGVLCLALPSCYSFGILALNRSGTVNDNNKAVKKLTLKNAPDFSFMLDSAGYHRLSYGINKLELDNKFGSLYQLRVYDSNATLIQAYSLCFGDFKNEKFLGENFPPSRNIGPNLNDHLDILNESENWIFAESEKLSFYSKVKESDIILVVVWSDDAMPYVTRIIKEVKRYKSQFPDKNLLEVYLNIPPYHLKTDSTYINELYNQLLSGGDVNAIIRGARALMMHGYYMNAVALLDSYNNKEITYEEECQINILLGVCHYMLDNPNNAIKYLEPQTRSKEHWSDAMEYYGKSLEAIGEYEAAINYYSSLNLTNHEFSVFVYPRIKICNFLSGQSEVWKELDRMKWRYPYSAEIHYELGLYYYKVNLSKSKTEFFRGAKSMEYYPLYSRKCLLQLMGKFEPNIYN